MKYNMETMIPHLQENPIRRAKWAFLTDGLDAVRRRMTEVLLDNQEANLASRATRSPLFEDQVTTTNFPTFTKFSFPLVRRVFPRLIANDLVSVQPMNQPTGKVFFFDIRYTGGLRVDDPANFDSAYASAGEGAALPELDLNISSSDVSAVSRKLKAKWTMESEQDLFAYYGLNAESELMSALSDEIAREIDRTVIDELFAFAGAGDTVWDSAQPTAGAWSTQSPKEYAKTLYDAIVDSNNLIFKKRYRNATWIVASADDATRLEKLENFRLFPAPDPIGTVVTGPHLFGTIASRWTVYKDPWLTAGTVLLGFRGASPLDTGYIFAPYIPLLTTAPFTDPNTLTTVRGMMTRFATKGVIPENYATVTIV